MSLAQRMIAFAAVLILRRFYLYQPLPSTLTVVPLAPSLRPNPNTLQLENNDALKSATKLFQGQILGAGESLLSVPSATTPTLSLPEPNPFYPSLSS